MKSNRSFFIAFLFSILLHLSLALSIKVSSDKLSLPEKKPIKISLIELPKKQPKEEKKEEKESEEHKQVVDLPPDHNAKKPKDSRFSSETDHQTERETVSRHRESTNTPAHEKTSEKESQSISGNEGSNTKDETDSSSANKKSTEKQNTENGKYPDSKSLPDNANELQSKDNKEKEVLRGPRNINLFPDKGKLSKISGAPQNDSIDDIPEGDGTFLNTAAFKYASFFNRVKRDVASMWNPLPELKRKDPTGKFYMFKSRRTILAVALDDKGYLLEANVKISSGVDFLDEEAIRAFFKCKQFPNPPAGLAKDGKILFDFGFDVSYEKRGLLY